MITPAPNSSTAAVGPLATTTMRVQAWRKETARLLGVSESVARQFGTTGLIEVEGKHVTLHPLRQASGEWLATARVARPPAVDEADWCDALLLANSQSMLLTHAAFGLVEGGDAILAMRIPSAHDHPRLHGADLNGLLAMCNALRDGVSSRTGAATRPVEARDTSRGMQPHASEAPSLDATSEVTALIRDSALHLGASQEQAVEAARTGSMELVGHRVGMACDPDDEALVVAIDLGDAFLDGAERCRIALAASLDLILQAGAAVGRTPHRCQLTARCELKEQSAAGLAAWLLDLAALAAAMRARHSQDLASRASATSEL